MKGKIILVVFLLLCVGFGINFIIDLSQIFSWQHIAIGFWLLQLADVIGGIILFLLFWFFFWLINKVFGKVSFRKLPEIIWSFFRIIPRFFKQVFPILKKLWREQSDKGGR